MGRAEAKKGSGEARDVVIVDAIRMGRAEAKYEQFGKKQPLPKTQSAWDALRQRSLRKEKTICTRSDAIRMGRAEAKLWIIAMMCGWGGTQSAWDALTKSAGVPSRYGTRTRYFRPA